MDWRDIPVFIVNRNRLGAMRTLIDWLLQAGMRRIVIMDNQSNYAPLLQYYETLPPGVRLMLMDANHGPFVLWQQGVHKVLDTPYIVTDSDLVPADFCPSDLVPALLQTLQRFPDAGKVGPGLRIDNLPDGYREVDTVRKWESQFWEQPLGDGCFAAPIDTTFALYPPRAEFTRDASNVRLGYPYLLEHTPWYADDRTLSEEEAFYRANTSAVFSHWSVDKKDSRVAQSQRVSGYSRRPKVLHLGGGHEHVYGWINADADGRLLDFRFDPASCCAHGLDLPDDSVDGVYMESTFTWVDDPHALLTELYRVARPGARLVLRLPHAHSDDRLADPRARKAYAETSFAHFAQSWPARRPSSYRADWQVHSIELSVSPDVAALGTQGALERVRAGRNVVLGMLVTLEAVKPARTPGRDLIVRPHLLVAGHQRLVPNFVVAANPGPVAAEVVQPVPSQIPALPSTPTAQPADFCSPDGHCAKVLHIDGGREYIPGRINAGSGTGRYDVPFDPQRCREQQLPLAEGSVDGIHLSHVLEGVRDAHALFDELYRVARPGAKLHIRVAHGARADAWADPQQQRAWHEGSFAHFAQPVLPDAAGAYRADWQVQALHLVVPAGSNPTLQQLRESHDLVQEMIVTMVAVKPARARAGQHPAHQIEPQLRVDRRVDASFAPA